MRRVARRTTALAAAVTSCVLGLGACGGQTPAGPAAPSTVAPTSAASPAAPASSAPAGSTGSGQSDPVVAFCRDFRANGGTGASFGGVPLFYRKEPLLKDLRERLDAMGDLRPPSEIAKPWALQEKTLLRIRSAAEQLRNDQTLYDDPTLPDPRTFHGGDIDEAQDTLTDYYFAHCR